MSILIDDEFITEAIGMCILTAIQEHEFDSNGISNMNEQDLEGIIEVRWLEFQHYKSSTLEDS